MKKGKKTQVTADYSVIFDACYCYSEKAKANFLKNEICAFLFASSYPILYKLFREQKQFLWEDVVSVMEEFYLLSYYAIKN